MFKSALSGYIACALSQAEYKQLEDRTFFGRIPACKGVVAFGASLRQCENKLQSVLEQWIFVGLKLGHCLPAIDGFDLVRPLLHDQHKTHALCFGRMSQLALDGPYSGIPISS